MVAAISVISGALLGRVAFPFGRSERIRQSVASEVPTDPHQLDDNTLRSVNAVLVRQLPMELYTRANEAAMLERGEWKAARDAIRSDLRIGVDNLAAGSEAWGVTSGLNENALRQVSTYYASAPDPELDEPARKLLSRYRAQSREELTKSRCKDAICTLAREH
jgi:hypothetical protein